jgi:peptidoglycan/LPS O-acetylase OafA/YrhL
MNRNFKRKYWYPISVDIEIRLRKLRRFVDRLYRKIWPLVFATVMLPYILFAVYQIHKDYSLIHNYANLDFANSDFYTRWNTDGKPGQEPPKN